MRNGRRSLGGILALGLVLSACSTQKTSTSGASASAAPSAASASPAGPLPQSPGTSQQPGGLQIPVQIHGGTVTPLNARFDAKVGEPITLRVDSDVADELHVHSVPDHEFEVLPKAGQVFSFTVSVPGQVAIELHNLGKTVATLIVR